MTQGPSQAFIDPVPSSFVQSLVTLRQRMNQSLNQSLQEGLRVLRANLPSLLVGLILVYLVVNKYRRQLNSIPGPFVAGFTDLWRFFDALFANPHETHIKLHRQTGSSLVRIGPRTVSVADPALIPKIYGLNSGFTKTKFYTLHMLSYHGQFTPSLFTTLDETYHSKYKRPIANAYSMSNLVDFEPLIDSTSALFMSRLDEFVASKETFNFGQWLQMYAFDVMCVLSLPPLVTPMVAK